VKHVIDELKQPIFIVLDGLDELPLRTKAREREQILELITRLIKDANSNLHILLASRAEHDIVKSLQGNSELKDAVRVWNVEGQLVDELHKFADKMRENDKTLQSSWKQEIIKKLMSGKEMYCALPSPVESASPANSMQVFSLCFLHARRSTSQRRTYEE
jgi:hypothetical protein